MGPKTHVLNLDRGPDGRIKSDTFFGGGAGEYLDKPKRVGGRYTIIRSDAALGCHTVVVIVLASRFRYCAQCCALPSKCWTQTYCMAAGE